MPKIRNFLHILQIRYAFCGVVVVVGGGATYWLFMSEISSEAQASA